MKIGDTGDGKKQEKGCIKKPMLVSWRDRQKERFGEWRKTGVQFPES